MDKPGLPAQSDSCFNKLKQIYLLACPASERHFRFGKLPAFCGFPGFDR